MTQPGLTQPSSFPRSQSPAPCQGEGDLRPTTYWPSVLHQYPRLPALHQLIVDRASGEQDQGDKGAAKRPKGSGP